MTVIVCTSYIFFGLVLKYFVIMAAFSLENDGSRIQCKDYSDDPFENADTLPKSSSQYLENVSDISDDDFKISVFTKVPGFKVLLWLYFSK